MIPPVVLAPEAARLSRFVRTAMLVASWPQSNRPSSRMVDVRPGAKNDSPHPMRPSSVSIRIIVQSKLASTTAVDTERILIQIAHCEAGRFCKSLDGRSVTASAGGRRLVGESVTRQPLHAQQTLWTPTQDPRS